MKHSILLSLLLAMMLSGLPKEGIRPALIDNLARTAARPTTVASNASPTSAIRESSRRNASDKFAIYTSTLAGENQTVVFSDPNREVNHARVSPDGNWFVFTRYNVFNRDGEALETNGYDQTEVVVCRIDGGECDVAISSRKRIIAANAYWTPDGKKLLFVSNDTPDARPSIQSYDLAGRQVLPFYAPEDLIVSDPHRVGRTVVMAGRLRSAPYLSRLYLVDADSKVRRQLTDPQYASFARMDPPLGDYDPKLSPDGKSIATMRRMGKDEWHLMVIDADSGTEMDLSRPNAVDAVPEWSSDGRLLIFWSVNPVNVKESGLYSIRPNGFERKRVPLPSGSFYTMPAFFPGSGSSPASRIIYSRKIDPRF